MTVMRFVLFLAALGFALPAIAAQENRPASSVDLLALQRFATCVVDRNKADARRVIESDFREEASDEARRRLARRHTHCAGPGDRLQMSGMLFAGAMAEALLRKELTESQLSELLLPSEPALESRSDSEFTGLCMALSHPTETAALIYSDSSSERGDALINAYARDLPQCVLQGQELRINKPGLRALVALAAYRIAGASRSGGES